MTEQVAIIDYGAGNLRSVHKALTRVAAGSAEILLTADPTVVSRADRIVLPGVGAFGDCMAGLNAVEGMRAALESRVIGQGVPFLGICVGMQLLADRGEEKGSWAGLGWVGGIVKKLTPPDGRKVPHMGWNELRPVRPHPVLAGLAAGEASHAYFVHSYHFVTTAREALLLIADYGQEVTAAVGRDNIVGTQFHPEKSQQAGLKLLANFLEWRV